MFLPSGVLPFSNLVAVSLDTEKPKEGENFHSARDWRAQWQKRKKENSRHTWEGCGWEDGTPPTNEDTSTQRFS